MIIYTGACSRSVSKGGNTWLKKPSKHLQMNDKKVVFHPFYCVSLDYMNGKPWIHFLMTMNAKLLRVRPSFMWQDEMNKETNRKNTENKWKKIGQYVQNEKRH